MAQLPAGALSASAEVEELREGDKKLRAFSSGSSQETAAPPGSDSEDGVPRRRVHFRSYDSVHAGFTPVSRLYGHDLMEFHIDAEGRMVHEIGGGDIDLGMTQAEDSLECIAEGGVAYFSEPRSDAPALGLPPMADGCRFVVADREDDWVSDGKGWLPLFLDGDEERPAFAIVGPVFSEELGLPRFALVISDAE